MTMTTMTTTARGTTTITAIISPLSALTGSGGVSQLSPSELLQARETIYLIHDAIYFINITSEFAKKWQAARLAVAIVHLPSVLGVLHTVFIELIAK